MPSMNDFAEFREKLRGLPGEAAANPAEWGEGLTMNVTSFRMSPYAAVQKAEERGFVEARGVGRHHILFEFTDFTPDEAWLADKALPMCDFLEEVGATKPRIEFDRSTR